MKKFILQYNAEGGPSGVKVLCADEFATTQSGGILFIRDNNVVAAFASYVACSEEAFGLECDSQTETWLAEQAAQGE